MPKKQSRIFVTGGLGTIGEYIESDIKPSIELLDIRDKNKTLSYVLVQKPDVIIHLAALTDQKICELDPKQAEEINVQGTANVCEAGEKVGALFVYISTNSVFDGTKQSAYLEHDETNPINQYGRTKLLGENIVRKNSSNWIIVRTSWVFGGKDGDKRFVGKIIGQIQNEKIRVASDNMGTPTYAKDLVFKINELIEKNKRGLFHVANSEPTSRLDQAKFITNYFNYKGTLVPCLLDSIDVPYKQPKNESLASESLKLRSWKDALKEYLDENYNNVEK